jgi:hypothetical protein
MSQRSFALAGGAVVAVVGLVLLIAYVGSTNEDAKAARNIKPIVLAIKRHEETFRAYPPRAVLDDDGKPLLSWRVQMLPFLEERGLFDKFRLSEPWDSPHNIQLLKQMPKVFGDAEGGWTRYVAPVAHGTLWEGNEGPRSVQATSLTIAVIRAPESKAVPWTKPDDVTVDMSNPFMSIGHGTRYVLACMCDTNVVCIKQAINPSALRALLTIASDDNGELNDSVRLKDFPSLYNTSTFSR